ncbi:MAG: leucine-rich repeat domain-containing protein [Bacteroidales bacterium]|nr:leucine-rich repeat domain-containing protein [Bacteroidales bacterium]MCF8458880.1 leucine-rich repeat domain-containing protein [Bacteroidales bacterium]
MIARNSILTILICLIGIGSTLAQDKLLSERKLKRQNTFTSIEEAMTKPDEVYKLKLGGEGKTLKDIPVEVFQLKNLQDLDLSSNRISLLPDELFKLTNLQKLDVSFNQISEIPAGIKQLTNLRVLLCKGCRLVSLPSELGQLQNLEELDLFANHIHSCPKD